MKLKQLLSVLLGFCLVLLLIPVASGGAQSPDWTPAWVEISETGDILSVGSGLDFDSQPISTERAPEWWLGFLDRLFPSLSRPLSPPSRTLDGWEVIFSDDFEGTFPGQWKVFDNDGADNGTYYWAPRDCRPYAGTNSAWAVGGGTDGSVLACGSDYPDYATTSLIYGPFSLEDASQAEFRLMYWLNTELSNDTLFVGASVNSTKYYGISTSGMVDWTERIFDLRSVPTLGDLTGESTVWVAIIYRSSEDIHISEGVYVDDVVLRKYVGAPPTATATPVPDNPKVFLPLISKQYPFIPEPPVLSEITNEDGDGNYTVSWSASEGASVYALEEDDASDFSSPTTVYTGFATSMAISGRDLGTYHYRVKAFSTGLSSAWSNVVSVTVTVPLLAMP